MGFERNHLMPYYLLYIAMQAEYRCNVSEFIQFEFDMTFSEYILESVHK